VNRNVHEEEESGNDGFGNEEPPATPT